MKNYFIIVAILAIVGYINADKKSNFKYNFKREQNLHIEVFKGGVLGNLTSEYLTDSTNFRVYVGTFDDERGYYHYNIKGDKVYVEKREHSLATDCLQPRLKLTEQKLFSLKELKNKHQFD